LSNGKKAVIIGAGIAGIASAIELAGSGVEVLMLESRSFPGGRMYSFMDDSTGEWLDNGQHLMIGAYDNFFRILRTLGTFKLLDYQTKLKVPSIDINGMKSVLGSSLFPGKAGLAAGLLRLNGVSLKSRINTLKLLNKIINNKIDVDGKTVGQMLEDSNQNKDIIQHFWEPLTLAILNSPSQLVSARLLADVLKKAISKGNESSCLYFPTTHLSELINPFEKWLEKNGGKILFKVQAVQLIFNNDKVIVRLQSGEQIESDLVISCVPFYALLKILPDELKNHEDFQGLNLYKSSAIISVYLWLDKDVVNMPFTGLIGTTTQWVFNRRLLCKADDEIVRKYPGHLALTISGANDLLDLPPEDIAKKCFEEVKHCFGSNDNLKLLNWKVIKEKRATFIASPEIEPIRLEQTTSFKNFYIAGDWTTTGLPATLEGAALSGFQAGKKASIYLAL
jgi:squalene-associated FAD-dependent desaturase